MKFGEISSIGVQIRTNRVLLMVDNACKYSSHVHGNMHNSAVLLLVGKQHCRLITNNDMSKPNIVSSFKFVVNIVNICYLC